MDERGGVMNISCLNCGMNNIYGTCIAEELGHKYGSALQCEYFVPIDVGNKPDKGEVEQCTKTH